MKCNCFVNIKSRPRSGLNGRGKMLRPSGGLGASDHQQASDENAVIFNYAVIRHCLHKELLRIK